MSFPEKHDLHWWDGWIQLKVSQVNTQNLCKKLFDNGIVLESNESIVQLYRLQPINLQFYSSWEETFNGYIHTFGYGHSPWWYTDDSHK